MDRLAEILSNPQLAWLVDRLVARIESGKPPDRGSATLSGATLEQRSSTDDLLGRRSTGGDTLSVPLARIASAAELRAAVESIRGPVANRRAEREADTAAWARLFDHWRGELPEPLLAPLETFASSGLLKRLAIRDIALADQLLRQFAAILGSAPHGDLLLASLAAKVTGDSHALDRGRPLGALCLLAIRDASGIDGTGSAEKRRTAWGEIGVTVDDLSAPVLCLNLRATPGTDLAPPLDWHAAHGEPFFLSWRLLQKFEPSPGTPAVYVCENPAVVSEAAARLGHRSHAVVCLNGAPNTTLKRLVTAVAAAGIPLHLHADFDWSGLRFVHQLRHLDGSQLWRMGAADYLACQPGAALKGEPFAPAWARDLADAMRQQGRAAYEEGMIETLLAELDKGSTG